MFRKLRRRQCLLRACSLSRTCGSGGRDRLEHVRWNDALAVPNSVTRRIDAYLESGCFRLGWAASNVVTKLILIHLFLQHVIGFGQSCDSWGFAMCVIGGEDV